MRSLADTLEHLVRPFSAGVVVPLFALFSAGVTIGGLSGLGASLRDPVTLGIIAGLVLGKPIGIVATVVPGHAVPSLSRSTSPWLGRTSSASVCWRASGSPCRCWSRS